MDQKWIQILVILVFYQKMTSGEEIVKENQRVEIRCNPKEMGTMVVWFRVLDQTGMEFIASFSNNGLRKSSPTPSDSLFAYTSVSHGVLILQSFRKTRDSGTYGCASLSKNELKFGQVTRLVGEQLKVVVAPPPATTTQQTQRQTTTPCNCSYANKKGETRPSLFCDLIILGPLAGGCGLLLLLLIITTVYCNQIRTRRCPHHYKRKPRMDPGKQMKSNTHI